MAEKRIILHIDLDAFFAKVEERENPQFRGKPLVVGADPKSGRGRGVVSTCNYEARRYGIRSAMPISEAWRRCPQAIFLPVNFKLYNEVSAKVMSILGDAAPMMEQVSVDEAYLDVSFLKDYLKAKNFAAALKRKIFEKEELPSSIGIGPNKLIAKIACQKAKPDGLMVVSPEDIDEFLEPLQVQELPGIGPKTAGRLKLAGADTIKNLKKIPRAELKEIFGKWGSSMYDKARGIDESKVSNAEIIKSIGKERTFERDTRDGDVIFSAFESIARDVWGELGAGGFAVKTITVVCRFSGFETHTKSKTLNCSCSAPAVDFETFRRESKKLLLRFIVDNPKPIRLIGLRVKVE